MIFILTGSVHSGKTTLLNRVVYELKEQGVKIDGFLSKAHEESGETLGYDLFDLKEERSMPYIRKKGEKQWQKIGSFFFIPQGLNKAEEIILRGKDADILIVDEVGPLELAGKGLWPTLKDVLFQPKTHCLLVIRIDILKDFLRILGKNRVKVFDVKDSEACPRLTEEIKKVV